MEKTEEEKIKESNKELYKDLAITAEDEEYNIEGGLYLGSSYWIFPDGEIKEY